MIVACLGGGQLGRMLAIAGLPLGVRMRFLDPSPRAPASLVAEHLVGEYDDPTMMERLGHGADAATYEFENVPLRAAERLSRSFSRHALGLAPSVRSLEIAQDRVREKCFFAECGVPVQRFAAIGTESDCDAAAARVGFPAILKTRRLGYDGKGQARVQSADELPSAWRSLHEAPSILEEFVPFEREVSVLVVRGRDGQTEAWPVVENVHLTGILASSVAPARVAPKVAEAAIDHALRIVHRLDHVGVLCVEFFLRGDELMANEMAPRVHNSGHWTIEGSCTSQFQNHLRAVVGLPLGSTEMRVEAVAMKNLVGEVPERAAVLADPRVALHLYGKTGRAGRKVGHLTLCGDLAAVQQWLRETPEWARGSPGTSPHNVAT